MEWTLDASVMIGLSVEMTLLCNISTAVASVDVSGVGSKIRWPTKDTSIVQEHQIIRVEISLEFSLCLINLESFAVQRLTYLLYNAWSVEVEVKPSFRMGKRVVVPTRLPRKG